MGISAGQKFLQIGVTVAIRVGGRRRAWGKRNSFCGRAERSGVQGYVVWGEDIDCRVVAGSIGQHRYVIAIAIATTSGDV